MKLSIIILSYNTQALLHCCLTSIDLSLNPEIIVVDNASADDSVSMVRSEFPQVTLICNSTNRGFAAGNNQALKIVRGEVILLLNSDTQLNPTTLPGLTSFLQDHPQAAVVTPKVVLPNGQIDWACHRGLPTPWNALTYFAKLERLFPRTKLFSGYHQSYKDMTVAHRVDAAAATALLVRKNAIDQVGGLDERFFFYAEDLDWCKRFADAGWEIWYDPEATVTHLKSASGKRKHTDKLNQQQSTAYFYSTMKQFYAKHYQTTYPRWLRRLVYWGIDLKQKLS